MRKAVLTIEDLKFAHSIAKAVASDAVAIEEFIFEETQSVQDRDLALSLDADVSLPSQDTTDMAETSRFAAELVDWNHVLQASRVVFGNWK